MKNIYFLLICMFFLIHHVVSQVLPGASAVNSITVAGGNGKGPAANQLDEPNNNVIDAAGNLYVADINNHRIQKWIPGALEGITVAGGNGPGPAANQLNRPTDVRIDIDGNLYISDEANHRVQKWVPGGAAGITVTGGNGPGSATNQLNRPAGIFVTEGGSIYIADYENHRVQLWLRNASTGTTVAGGNGYGSADNQLAYPNDVFVNREIYVADQNNHRIQRWAFGSSTGVTVAGGNGPGTASNQLNFPTGIYVDGARSIYIADFHNHRVQRWAFGGLTGSTVAGGNGQGSAANQLDRPVNIYVDAMQNLFVSDAFNDRVLKFVKADADAPGSKSMGITVAGGNGYGTAANQLSFPDDVFVNASGNIFISDGGRVQKWAPGASAGITVAGGNLYESIPAEPFVSYGIFVDANENIFIADYRFGRILKWVPGATAGVSVTGANGRLFTPNSVVFDAAGVMYTSEFYNNSIKKWAPGAAVGVVVIGSSRGAGPAADQINIPLDISLDATGNIYVAEQENYRITKWAPGAASGIIVAGGNGFGAEANQLSVATGVFVDPAGNIYVADKLNHRIQKWAPGASEGITIAGGNGRGSAANQLDRPADIFVGANGDLYVADNGNYRIQKFVNTDIDVTFCPANLKFAAPSCTEKATISWTAPTDTFPATITTPESIDPARGTFTFMGAIDGHGYYRSTGKHLWASARDIAKSIGANGHLATLTSDEETNLIFKQIKNSGYSPWIGLSNTGKPGRFRWVNGEPLTYTNWAPGEPNNFGGSRRSITEPYVRMVDTSGTWNDQRDDYLPFIVEFEKPLIRNRQISGPKNGSAQKPGIYTVCYERRDFTTDKRDTCCFTVTVTCNESLITQVTGSVLEKESPVNGINGLRITTSPNPSSHIFRLNIVSDDNEKISLQVTDVSGRIVETRNGVMPNQPLTVGAGYRPGIYFARVIQGNKKTTIRLIRQAK